MVGRWSMPRNISPVVLFCVLAVGCNRGPTWNLASVDGTVTTDGSPLHGLQVVFMADFDAGMQGPRSTGTTDEAGHYRLRTDNGDEGAVVGKHRVLLLDFEAEGKLALDNLSERLWKEAKRQSPEMAKHREELR